MTRWMLFQQATELVFSRSLIYVMETKVLSYQNCTAVSFDSTSLRSIGQY